MGLRPTFPGNPRQKHQYNVIIDGIESAWFEKATIPKVETETDEFNSAGSVRSTKFGGRKKIGDATFVKGMRADAADLEAYNWFRAGVDSVAGDLGDPEVYKKDIEIVHVNRVGAVIQRWKLIGARCQAIDWGENDGGSSEHVIETMTVVCDDCIPE